MATVVQSPYGPIDIDTGEAETVSSSIVIFNPALKGVDEGGNPIIVLVATISPNDRELWCIDAEGKLKVKRLSEVTADWRYDVAKEEWTDAAGSSLEAE